MYCKNLTTLVNNYVKLVITFIKLTCTIELKTFVSWTRGQSVSLNCILKDRYRLKESWVRDWDVSVWYILRNSYSYVILLRNNEFEIELYLYSVRYIFMETRASYLDWYRLSIIAESQPRVVSWKILIQEYNSPGAYGKSTKAYFFRMLQFLTWRKSKVFFKS